MSIFSSLRLSPFGLCSVLLAFLFAGLSGWVHGSLTFLDLATIGGAIGGHFGRDELGATRLCLKIPPQSPRAKEHLSAGRRGRRAQRGG